MQEKHSHPERQSLGFTEAVEEIITPILISRGFVCAVNGTNTFEYRSSKVVFCIGHDPISFEIDMCFALTDSPSDRYGLQEVLDFILGPHHGVQAFFQASQRHHVVYCIRSIADTLQKCDNAIWSGDFAVYQSMKMRAQENSERLTNQIVQAPTRQAADVAWRQHDYEKVRDLYGSIERDLTSVEKGRLNYARSRTHTEDNSTS